MYGCQICSILYFNDKSDFLVIFRGENTLLEWNWSVFNLIDFQGESVLLQWDCSPLCQCMSARYVLF